MRTFWGFIPAGPTFGYWEVSEIWIPGKAPGDALFEEYTRFTLNENSATTVRGGWNLLLLHDQLFFGPAADFVGTPGRGSLCDSAPTSLFSSPSTCLSLPISRCPS